MSTKQYDPFAGMYLRNPATLADFERFQVTICDENAILSPRWPGQLLAMFNSLTGGMNLMLESIMDPDRGSSDTTNADECLEAGCPSCAVSEVNFWADIAEQTRKMFSIIDHYAEEAIEDPMAGFKWGHEIAEIEGYETLAQIQKLCREAMVVFDELQICGIIASEENK